MGRFLRGRKVEVNRLDGGEPVSLCDAPAGRGAAWAEDGNIIAALITQSGLSQVPVEGGKPISLTELRPGDNSHRWPQILPGVKSVLFTITANAAYHEGAGIAAVSLRDHRTKILLDHAGYYPRYLPSGHLAYVSKGTLFAVPFDLDRLEVRGKAMPLWEVSSDPTLGYSQFDFSRSGTLAYRTGRTEILRTIQWVDATGKTAPLWPEPAAYLFPRVSPDGNRLALTVSQESSADIWIYDLQRDSKTRLTSGADFNSFPVWSRDGQFVVFQSLGGMFWARADGAGKPQSLIRSKTLQYPNSFSRDGTRLVFSEIIASGGAEIRIVPVESRSGSLYAGEPQSFLKTATGNTSATFSYDGRWLAYADAEAGRYEVYVRAFPDNGTKVQVSNAGGMLPAWSRQELLYRTADQRIMAARYTVERGRFKVEKPRLWSGKQLANLGDAKNFDAAPDGQRLAVLMPLGGQEPAGSRSHVMLEMNFFDELRRRVPLNK